jgi:hypothetical protein
MDTPIYHVLSLSHLPSMCVCVCVCVHAAWDQTQNLKYIK